MCPQTHTRTAELIINPMFAPPPIRLLAPERTSEGVFSSTRSHFLHPHSVFGKDQSCCLPQGSVGVMELLGHLIQYHCAQSQRLRRDTERRAGTLRLTFWSSSSGSAWSEGTEVARVCIQFLSEKSRGIDNDSQGKRERKERRRKHPITKYLQRLMWKKTKHQLKPGKEKNCIHAWMETHIHNREKWNGKKWIAPQERKLGHFNEVMAAIMLSRALSLRGHGCIGFLAVWECKVMCFWRERPCLLTWLKAWGK